MDAVSAYVGPASAGPSLMRGAIVGFGEVARHGHWPAYADSPPAVDRRRRRAERRAARARREPFAPGCAPTRRSTRWPPPSRSISSTSARRRRCTARPMLDALERGWHVVCEKPFLLDAGAADAGARARARRGGVAAVPVHNWKFAPIVQRGDGAASRRGEIGRLERVEIETERLRDFQGADPDRPELAARSGDRRRRHPDGSRLARAVPRAGLVRRESRAASRRRCIGRGLARSRTKRRVRLAFDGGEATITLTWNGTARRNSMRLDRRRRCRSTIADDRLLVRGRSSDEDVTFPVALSGGSHHADWFAAFIPQLAGYFNDPGLVASGVRRSGGVLPHHPAGVRDGSQTV